MHFARLPFPFFKYISLPKRVIECIPKTYLSNMQTKYTYKEIWLIAYPILISLLMEQMIGMTDTAFLGRVGHCRHLLHSNVHGGIRFQYRSANSDSTAQRRTAI